MGGNHQIKDCRIKLCGIGGCKGKHNRLLHPKVKADQNSTSTFANGNIVRQKGLLQVAAVRLFGLNGRVEDTWALCDTGSTQTWVDDTLIDKLGVEGQDITLEVSGIHGTRSMKTRSVPIKIGRKNSSVKDAALVIANCHKNLDIGNSVYNLKTLKDAYPYLRCIQQNRIDVGRVKVILGQDCYSLIRPLEYRNNGQHKPWAVRTQLGWMVCGPLPADEICECAVVSTNFSNQESRLAEQLRHWWDLKSYGTQYKVDNRSKEDREALKILEKSIKHDGTIYATKLPLRKEINQLPNNYTTAYGQFQSCEALKILEKSIKLDGTRYVTKLPLRKEINQLPNNYTTAYGQFQSLEKRLSSNLDLKKKYSQTIDLDLEKGYVIRLGQSEMALSEDQKEWYLPHHPVKHPHKIEKVRRVCNAAAKHQGVSINDMLMTGPDLLQKLFAVLIKFRQPKWAMTADIESMFLQVGVDKSDQSSLRF